ncbi:hypothetical protein A8B98_23570 [Hymenobacter sp. UV11]|nr:hypothetical protein A8B98_23570 [Hymenobacter sp. UV11]
MLAAACLLPALGQAQAITYSAPLVITRAGTYTGNYQSLASGVPCILVNTTEAVVLEGCNLSGAGYLIQSGTGANLTVRNCSGVALAPSVDGQSPGHFLDTYQSASLVVEHNYLSGTSGIVVNRWAGNGALTVRYNQVRNVDGRWRNNGGSTRSSFLQLNTVQNLAGVDIAYNEVINTPNQSLVEDNINLYNSSGTAGSPIRVHDNFVRGAYPYPATAGQFTGTGMTTDGDGATLGLAAGYIEASNNQFVSTCNAAMNIAAGHDVYYHDNRMVTSGLLPDGTRLNATYAGTAVFNYYNQLASVFFNNRIANNTIGYVRWGANSPYPDRQDISPGACATCTGTNSLPNPITVATEDNEYVLWQQKLAQNGVTVGPLGTTAPAPTPAPTPTPVTSVGTILNPGFEADNTAVGAPTGWQTTTGQGTNDNADYTESYGGAHAGTYHGTHYRPEAYEVYTYQVVTGLANGTYTLNAWVKSSGGQNTAQLQAKNYGGAALSSAIGASPGTWVQVAVQNISVTNGQCEIGFYSKANASNWLYFDDVTLVPAANTPPTVSLAASAATLTLGQTVTLSATAANANGTVAKVEFFNGTTKLGEATTTPYQLSWTPAAGTYSLTAVATNNTGASTTSAATSLTVSAVPTTTPTTPVATGNNLVVNPGFEADGLPVGAPTGWQTTTGQGTNDNADYTEAYPGAHGGLYHGTHYRPESYTVYTYQVINNLPAGTYSLSAWMKSSGGQNQAQLQAKNFGGTALAADVPTTPDGQWVRVTIPNITVSSGQCEIGFYSQANKGQWLYFDDVELVQQGGSLPATSPADASSADTSSLYPNPADNQVTLSMPFSRTDIVVISVLNAQGNLAAQHWRVATPGANQFTITTAYLPSGPYTLRVTSNTQAASILRLEVKH